jgi:methionine-gamma-lyase
MVNPMQSNEEKNETDGLNPQIKPHSLPIYQTSVYDYPDLKSLDDFYNGKLPGAYIYSRNGLPNSAELGMRVAAFEGTEAGTVCSSGMGALFIAIMSVLNSGDHIVASNDLYGGTTTLLRDELIRFGIQTTFADASNAEIFRGSVRNGTKMIIVETISNPTMKVCDIPSMADIALEKNVHLLVDNTFASPFVVKPAKLGADTVMHSGTKYLGGHDDLTIGILCGKSDQISRMSQFCTRSGVIAGPFDCWLASRSLATWKIRVRESSDNAAKLADYLESKSEKISKVYYPGLASHPQHGLARKIFTNGLFGGMLAFDLRSGLDSAEKFVSALHRITLTPSLGGTSTSISHPGKTSHRYLTQDQKLKSGITDAMIRVSTGIEPYEEIEEEFGRALDLA